MRRLLLTVLLGTSMIATSAHAQRTRPTPHQLLDRAMQPVSQALADLHATDDERRETADVLAQAESLAASIVEAQQQNASERVRLLTHRMQLIARIVQGRIQARRDEERASNAERSAAAADARRVQARAALERAAENRLEADRGESASAPVVSPSGAPPSASPSPGATP